LIYWNNILAFISV